MQVCAKIISEKNQFYNAESYSLLKVHSCLVQGILKSSVTFVLLRKRYLEQKLEHLKQNKKQKRVANATHTFPHDKQPMQRIISQRQPEALQQMLMWRCQGFYVQAIHTVGSPLSHIASYKVQACSISLQYTQNHRATGNIKCHFKSQLI